MKYFALILLFLAFLIAFNYKSNNFNNNLAEVVIQVNNLNSNQIVNSLEHDFNSINGVNFIEGSLMSSTITLRVSNNDVTIQEIKKLIQKWGCDLLDIDYKFIKFKSNSFKN